MIAVYMEYPCGSGWVGELRFSIALFSDSHGLNKHLGTATAL